ncbi:MAG: ABC transporter ATP-binding protein [Ignavibacteriaceae bacterium]
MNDIIIKVENLRKSYQTAGKNKLEILRNINAEFPTGKITIIVGASGAGKSTLLHHLGGLDRPDEGKIFFRNENIFTYSEEKLARFRNKHVGFIFQFHHLLPEFSAVENVMIPQLISKCKSQNAKQRAMELLSIVGMNERLEHKPAELSGGEQQRVAVARALANDPEIILADEPTGNLDSINSISIHKLIKKLNESLGKTFIIVTHNPNLTALGDIIYQMKDGTLEKAKT